MMNNRTILIVDTQLDGHHVLWLAMVSEVLLRHNYKVVLLINSNIKEVYERIKLLLPDFIEQVTLVPSRYLQKPNLYSYWHELFFTFTKYQCDEVILNNFDTIASKVLRLSCFGYFPPKNLSGKISIIYHRPRPLDQSQQGFSNWWKRCGWNILVGKSYFKHIWLLDQYLISELQKNNQINYSFIPDPWRVSKSMQTLPELFLENNDRNIYLLQYGVGDKRKGSELLLQALSKSSNNRLHLWLVGKQKDKKILELAKELAAQNKVTIVDRYITEEEEAWCFFNCDWVTLPYLSHYGSSNLLSKAAKFCKPVIASDFHLLGRNVQQYKLGLVFNDQSVDSLVDILDNLPNNLETINKHDMLKFADNYSHIEFEKSLINGFLLE